MIRFNWKVLKAEKINNIWESEKVSKVKSIYSPNFEIVNDI